MLSKAIQPRTGEYDYLIVALKRPSQKIDSDVITQVKKYATAVVRDQRFHGVNSRWTFIAISNELDDFARRESNQRGRLKGRYTTMRILISLSGSRPGLRSSMTPNRGFSS